MGSSRASAATTADKAPRPLQRVPGYIPPAEEASWSIALDRLQPGREARSHWQEKAGTVLFIRPLGSCTSRPAPRGVTWAEPRDCSLLSLAAFGKPGEMGKAQAR